MTPDPVNVYGQRTSQELVQHDVAVRQAMLQRGRSMLSIASSSISTSWGLLPPPTDRSRCRSIRGLSVKSTRAASVPRCAR